MSKTKQMTPAEEDNFERDMAGSSGSSLNDWETDLAERVLQLEILINKAGAKGDKYVIQMLKRKLIPLKAAVKLNETNPKVAASLAGKGGLARIIEYVTKKAQDSATEEEMADSINSVKATLPGYRLSEKLGKVKSVLIRDNNAALSSGDLELDV